MKTFGLIGYPLSHSFSRKYFLEKFKLENINGVSYKNFSINSINLFPDIIKTEKNIAGFNVTSPYKKQIIPFLDKLDLLAKEIGAVNVIKIKKCDGNIELIGYNTDVYGFEKSLKKHLNSDIKNALILGTGGAAKAVAYALRTLKIDYLFVSSKKEKINNKTIQYSDLSSEIIANNKLIVNATPLGIFPDINKKPYIPYKFISKSHILFDLIYNPTETLFLKEGKNRNAKIINGYEMLIFQAEKAWEVFNS